MCCELTRWPSFLGDKFPAVKRFGIEGAEAVLLGLLALVTRGAELGVEGVELGMAHRGRLNVRLERYHVGCAHSNLFSLLFSPLFLSLSSHLISPLLSFSCFLVSPSLFSLSPILTSPLLSWSLLCFSLFFSGSCQLVRKTSRGSLQRIY